MSMLSPFGYCGAFMLMRHSGNAKLSSSGTISSTSRRRAGARSGASRNSQKLSATGLMIDPSHEVAPPERSEAPDPGRDAEQHGPQDPEQQQARRSDPVREEEADRAERRQLRLRGRQQRE